MAKKVTIQQFGAAERTMDEVASLSQLISVLGLSNPSIKVNGVTVDSGYELKDYDYVSFGDKVKGGL